MTTSFAGGGIPRSDSLDSIPSVDFLIETLEHEVLALQEPTISEFKRKETNGELQVEPLLTPDKSRFVLFPIKHTDVSICEGKVHKFELFPFYRLPLVSPLLPLTSLSLLLREHTRAQTHTHTHTH
jgi:hypothetical protein